MATLVADPDTRIIDISGPVGGFTTVDMQEDVYSRLKDDWHSDSSLSRLRFPFRSFGDQKNQQNQIGPYVFFNNIDGWRLRPSDDDQELTILGNLIPESAVQGLQIPTFISRPGRQILVLSEQSAQALGADKEAIAQEVWDHPVRASVPALDTAARSTAEGGFQNGAVWLDVQDGRDTNIGAVSQPVQTFARAREIAREWSLKRIRVVSQMDAILDVDLLAMEVISDSRLGNMLLDFNAKAVAAAHFEGMGLTGTIVPAESGAILHYPMNESSGTNVPDVSGQSNNGTTVNMDDTNWVTGKLNNGLQFDGIDEYITCGTTPGAFERTDEFSAEAWIKTTGTVQTIFDRMANVSGGRGWWVRTQSSGRIQVILANNFVGAANRIQVFTDTADPSFIAVDDGNWHHVVFTYDGSSLAVGCQIWIDGVNQVLNVVNDNLSDTILVPTQNLLIGQRGFGVGIPFAGTMDETLVYSKKLSSLEITERYNGGTGTEMAGLEEFIFSAAYCIFYSPTMEIVGSFVDCGFVCAVGDVFKIKPDTTRLVNCYAAAVEETSLVAPRFNFAGTDVDTIFRGWSGSLDLLGLDDAASKVEVEVTSGTVTIDSSCTSGTVVVRGGAQVILVDNSAGTTVIDERPISGSGSGYVDGAVWISQSGSDANDGTVTKPVLTLTRAKQIADANLLRRFKFATDVFFTLSQAYQSYQFFNSLVGNKFVDLNNQNVAGSDFFDITLTGAISGAFATISGSRCLFFNTVTNLAGAFFECQFLQQKPGQFVQFAGGSVTTLIDCVASNTKFDNVYNSPKFVVSGSDVDVSFRRWSGRMLVDGMDNSTSALEIECSGAEIVILNTCVDGTIVVRGIGTLVDSSGAGCTVIDETTQYQVWEENRLAHETVGTFGEWVGKKLLTFSKFVGLR